MLRTLGAFAEERIRERTLSGIRMRLSGTQREERQAVAQGVRRYTLTALVHQYGAPFSSIKRAVYRAEQASQPRLIE